MARITLITDFGTVDGYVGVMKGILASMAPGVLLDDITHQIPPGDVVKASRVLGRSWRHFPAGTVHLVVVDPGVGTDRRGLVLETGGQFFVAPDNGVLSHVMAGREDWSCVALPSPLPSPGGNTFHGRDLFAPAAAVLASGTKPAEMGKPIRDLVLTRETHAGRSGTFRSSGRGSGRVVEVDRFGNLAVDLPVGEVKEAGGVEVGGVSVPLVATYGHGKDSDLMAVVNSDGLVEIAVRNGSAAERLDLTVGGEVSLMDLDR